MSEPQTLRKDDTISPARLVAATVSESDDESDHKNQQSKENSPCQEEEEIKE